MRLSKPNKCQSSREKKTTQATAIYKSSRISDSTAVPRLRIFQTPIKHTDSADEVSYRPEENITDK